MLFKTFIMGTLLLDLGTGTTDKSCYEAGWTFDQVVHNGDVTAYTDKFCEDKADQNVTAGESVREIKSRMRLDTVTEKG